MLNKNLAGFFAFFLGMFGAHRFYLGQWWRGALQFAGFWGVLFALVESRGELPLPFIMAALVIAPIITALIFWATPYEQWAAKYDPEALTERQRTVQYASPALPASRRSLKPLKAEGKKYYLSGDYDLAVEAFEEAREIDPGDAVVNFNLACCYAQLNQFPAALRQLEVAITFDLPKPGRIDTHPALEELRKTSEFAAFRANNFRRISFLQQQEEPTEESEEVLEDFDNPPKRSTSDPDLLQQIARLRELHDAGILTEEEYRRQREKLLG